MPIDGAVTAASMATLFTGALPDRHGLVGNVYREGFGGQEQDAFEHRMLAEPLWESVSRQGRRVASLNLRLPGYRHDAVVAEWVQRPGALEGRFDAGPASFARELQQRTGPPPPAPDLGGFLAGSVPADVFAQQVETVALRRREIIRYALAQLPFDLLIVDENVVDALLHPFLGRAASHVERARQLASETAATVIAELPRGTVLIVVSPYGMAPVSEAISLVPVLEAAGFDVRGPRATIEISAYGPVAHLYLSPTIDAAAVVTALRKATHPRDGAPLLARVEHRNRQPSLPLFHPIRGGEVVALARPGSVLSADAGAVTPRFPGDHGHDAHAPGVRGFLFVHAAGRLRRLPDTIRDVDVAPTVACQLGIQPAAQAQGTAHRLFEGSRCPD